MARADCPECGGTGWKTVETPATSGQRGAEGAVRQAVLCACTREGREDSLFERARIPQRYRHCDFENFETDVQYEGAQAKEWHASLKRAKTVAEAFVREYPAGAREGLLLMGRPGVGKTHLGIAALRGLVQRGHDGLFYDYGELLKEIQASYNPVSQASEMDVLEPVVKVEVLLLDDLGASKPSAWALETVGYILNARYNANLPTLLTTNYLDREEPAPQQMVTGQRFTVAPESLSSRIGERMRSRLFEMCRTIEMKSADYRRDIRRAGPLRA